VIKIGRLHIQPWKFLRALFLLGLFVCVCIAGVMLP
jgi:hypothetical protein